MGIWENVKDMTKEETSMEFTRTIHTDIKMFNTKCADFKTHKHE